MGSGCMGGPPNGNGAATPPRATVGPGLLDVRSLSLYPLLMLKSSISSKGQVTVPVEIRERLGLATGTAVLFELRPDGVLLKKGTLGAHPVDRVFGLIRPTHPTDSLTLLDQMRG